MSDETEDKATKKKKVAKKEAAAKKAEAAKDFETKKKPFIRLHTLAVFAFAALAWFAPTIIAKTRLRHDILNYAYPELGQRLNSRAANFSWTSPLTLEDVVIYDTEKRELVNVPLLQTDRTLLELISHPSELGTITLQKPKVNVITESGTSNLEKTLEVLFPTTDDSTSPPNVVVQIEDAQVLISDANSSSPQHLDHCNLTIAIPSASHAQFMDVTMRGIARASSVDADETSRTKPVPLPSQFESFPGYFNVTLEGQMPTDSQTTIASSGNGKLTTNQFPVHVLTPVFTRLGMNIDCNGACTGQADVTWNIHDQLAATCKWKIDGKDVSVHAEQLANNERLHSAHLRSNGELAISGDEVAFNKASLDTAPIKLSLTGKTLLSSWANTDWQRQTLATLMNEDYQFNGQIDIARISQMLPQTVRLRQDMQMTSGQLGWVLTSESNDQQRRWKSIIKATKLSALSGGQTIEWNEPIEIDFVAKRQGPTTDIERLNCKSSFITMSAQGSFDQAEVKSQIDLDRLSYELQRFFDLRDFKLAGQLDTRFKHTLAEEQNLSTQTDLSIRNFHLKMPGYEPWVEKLLVSRLTTKGQWNHNQIRTLDAFNFAMKSDQDRLDASLAEPFDIRSAAPNVRLQFKTRGGINTWLTRLTPLIGPSKVNARGALQATGNLEINDNAIAWSNIDANLNNVELDSPDFQFADAAVQANFSGQFDRNQSIATFNDLNIRSQNIDFRSPQIVVNMPGDSAPAVDGRATFRANLATLQNLMKQSSNDYRVAGEIRGEVAWKQSHSLSQASWQTTINQFAVASAEQVVPANQNFSRNPNSRIPTRNVSSSRQWATIWREQAPIKFDGKVSADWAMNALDIKNISLATPGLTASAQGEMTDLEGVCQTKLDGQLEYDAAKVMERLKEYLGPEWNIQGAQQRRFSMQGPIFAKASSDPNQPIAYSDQLTAHASLGWNSANIYGFQAGPGDLTADLNNRVIQFAPLDLSVGQGRIKGSPQIRLDMPEPTLTASKTHFVEKIELTPEMCATWMKYAAPLLADATRANGQFSMYVANANVPLFNYQDSDVASSIRVHSAQLRPGPMANQLLQITQQVEAILKKGITSSGNGAQGELITIPPQDIDIRMMKQRVYHRRIQMQVRDMTITTRGSVGLNQTLDIVAMIPIQDKWIGSNKYLASMKGQTIDVPIRGTFSQPQVDQQVLQQLASKVATSAASNFIQDNLQKQLEKQLPGSSNSPLGEELGKQLQNFLQ